MSTIYSKFPSQDVACIADTARLSAMASKVTHETKLFGIYFNVIIAQFAASDAINIAHGT
jgi:hypothetical protein